MCDIVEIKVIAEWGEFIASFGKFDAACVQQLVEIATKENMACLTYIDIPGNTDACFNTPQCVEIKQELMILKTYKELDQKLLHAIENAVDVSIKEEAFVKFECVD